MKIQQITKKFQNIQMRINSKLIRYILWILVPILILVCCLLIPEYYFNRQDQKISHATIQQDMEPVDLSIVSDISVFDKMLLIRQISDYSLVNLNFNYNDTYSYTDIHDIALDELEDMLGQLNLPIYIDGIYEMIIEKYLVSSDSNSSLNFTVWYITIQYFGCPMTIVLDYDTFSILYFSVDFRSSMNSYYSAEGFLNMAYYDTAIVPFLEFLEADESADVFEEEDELSFIFADMIANYYGCDVSLASHSTNDADIAEIQWHYTADTNASYNNSIIENYEYLSTNHMYEYTISSRNSDYSYLVEKNNLYMAFNGYVYPDGK